MKTSRFILFVTLSLISLVASAQTKLPDSGRRSAGRHIYKMEKENLRHVYLENNELTEELLGEYVGSFAATDSLPVLSRGNYAIVEAKGNKLNISDYTSDDFSYKLLSPEEVMLCLHDSLGRIITDAIVKSGSKTWKFDPLTQTYHAKNRTGTQVVEVNNQGVYHYIEIEQQNNYYTTRMERFLEKIDRSWYQLTERVHDLFSPNKRSIKQKYTGFVAFSKPKYRPGETVKLKAYIAELDGTPYTQPVAVKLYSFFSVRVDTILAHIEPYRPGMYEYQFELSDKLNLTLDCDYTINIRTSNKYHNAVVNHFRYEDYELQSVRFSMNCRNDKYAKGDSIKVKFKLTDENEMPLYDGKVELLVKPGHLSLAHPREKSSVFVPDTLRSYTLSLAGTQKRELVLPDTLFPAGVSGYYQLIATYTSSSNEQKTEIKRIYRQDDNNIPATPVAKPLSCQFYRRNDSVYLKVDNPEKIPFWYAIRKNNRKVTHGYTTQLNYSQKDKEDGYVAQLTYFQGEEKKTIEKALPFIRKNISMNVSTPTTVYPGQQTEVCVSVVDKRGKPVSDVDITAYAFTSKFEKQAMPYLIVPGKKVHARELRPRHYKCTKNGIADQSTYMTWEKWKTTLALDTIEYYKFLYPKPFYAYTEPTTDSTTQVSPYVVLDGNLQKVHLLWIDERLYYTSVAEQSEVYAFHIEPGYHKLKFRTYDREVSVQNVYIKGGARNILSFHIGQPCSVTGMKKNPRFPLAISPRLLNKKAWGVLTNKEIQYLSGQLITITPNFGSIKLPNLHHALDVPAYIKSGNTYYNINHAVRTKYDHTLRGHVNLPVLVGPFPRRNILNNVTNVASVHREENELISFIELEGGNRYTVYPGYQKIKSWSKTPFERGLSEYTSVTDFRETAFTVEEILQRARDKQLFTLRESHGFAEVRDKPGRSTLGKCRLMLSLGDDTKEKRQKPILIFVAPVEKERIAEYQLHYGGTRYFSNLPAGEVNISLLSSDSLVYTHSLTLRPNGQSFLHLDSILYAVDKPLAQSVFNLFNREVVKTYPPNPYAVHPTKDTVSLVPEQDFQMYNEGNAQTGTISGIIRDDEGEPLIGASVRVVGKNIATITNLDGYFEISGGSDNDKIEFAYIGYTTKQLNYTPGYGYNIKMEADHQALDEVVVVGYATSPKTNVTGVVAAYYPDIFIRGTSSSDTTPPLILVDGVIYEGELSDIDSSAILSLDILKDASGTAIYGARASGGVIIIQTNGTGSMLPKTQPIEPIPLMATGNTMRRNFHDDAFWQPRLTTDKAGKASFQVTYPDDITGWDAYFVAVGTKKQIDKQRMTIKSLKTLAAGLSAPRFAVRGDRLYAVGKITNHTGDTLSVHRTIKSGLEQAQEETVTLTTSHIDYIPVKVGEGDSITVAYFMQMANGYFDGEERSIPIVEPGMEQTLGTFEVLSDTTSTLFTFDPKLGPVTIYAEASALDIFLREIEKVDAYPYMCNEQMASKIKVLLSKKKIYAMLNREFKEEKKIKNLIARLNKNKNNDGLWGWWNKDNTRQWISNQVITALLDAEEAGYKSEPDKQHLREKLLKELNTGLSNLTYTAPNETRRAKPQQLELLMMLKRLDAPIDYNAYFKQINSLPNLTPVYNLKALEAMAAIGLKDEIRTASLLQNLQYTMLGGAYWREEKSTPSHRGFMLPYNNDTEHTLSAYRILKAVGGHTQELEKIRLHFFRMRREGAWANTYESSCIIETILPDILTPEQTRTEAALMLDGRRVTQFPFSEQREVSDVPLRIRKEGTLPVFVTAYQHGWNPDPAPESNKGFAVQTVFKANGDTLSYLTAGKTVQLEVTVDVEADAEYIQLEVPIPAGCSYESKHGGNYWNEAHREHFKNKVVIFSNKLTKGKHSFTIDLLPRFTGRYYLNPAKVELMYFPTFYGNERMKRVRIEEEGC